MTSTDFYTTAANQARVATEKSVELYKQGTQTLVEQANSVTAFPAVDLGAPVRRYFDLLQQTMDKNREFATKWVEMMNSFSGTFRGQVESFGNVVKDQSFKVADLVTEQAAKADKVAQEQATAVEQAAQDAAAAAEQVEKDLVKEAKKAEREQAKKAHEEARSAYEGLTKAELSEKLADRDLPKTGTVDELIERLVAADTE